MRVLGRIISFTETSIGYEADPRHIESALAAYGMEDCNSLSTPWAAESRESVDLNLRRKDAQVSRVEEMAWKDDVESPGLGPEETTTYQSVAARLNYLGLDRTDFQFPIKEHMRKMSDPNVEDEHRLKRTLRYLKGGSQSHSHVPLRGTPRQVHCVR